MTGWLWQDIPSLIRSGSVPTLSTLDTGHMGPAPSTTLPAYSQSQLQCVSLDIYVLSTTSNLYHSIFSMGQNETK